MQPSKTLALVGGDVALEGNGQAQDGGGLTAAGGRIELGSVAGTGLVSLNSMDEGWALGYEAVPNFKDIQLTQGAFVNASGEGGGDIQVYGRQVTITDGSGIFNATLGAEPGGTLTVTASESVKLIGAVIAPNRTYPSALFSRTFGPGKAGDIKIKTGQLTIQDGATISTEVSSKTATGRGGNLTVIARDSVELKKDSFLLTQTSGIGNAGDLTIETGRMIVQDGAVVSAATFGQGNGGDIQVNASDSVNISGVDSSGFSSGLLTRTAGVGQGGNITVNTSDFRVADSAVVDAITIAKGNGGSITLNAHTLEAVNGGQILTTTRDKGNAGNIIVNATDSFTLSGSDPTFAERVALLGRDSVDNEGPASGLFANTDVDSTGNGGNISIDPIKLNITDSAGITVDSLGKGNAGNLQLQAGLLNLDRGAFLSATTLSGERGNIMLNTQDLRLRHNSSITTNASNNANGGNITIDTDVLVALENSKIDANAFVGQGGNIQITTQGLFRSPDSGITASSQKGINGTVQINTLVNNPSQGLVSLPVKPVDVTGQIAQGCPAGIGPRASKFVVTGRGGLPPDPMEALRSEPTLADLGTTVQNQENRTSATTSSNPTSSEPAPLVEAQGWVTNSKGEVVLVAQAPTAILHIPWLTPTICQATKFAS